MSYLLSIENGGFPIQPFIFIFLIVSIIIGIYLLNKSEIYSNYVRKLSNILFVIEIIIGIGLFIVQILMSAMGEPFNIISIIVIIYSLILLIQPFYFRAIDDSHYNSEVFSKRPGCSEDIVKSILPNYSLESLKKELYNSYINTKIGVSDENYDLLANSCTNELFNTYLEHNKIDKLKGEKTINKRYRKKFLSISDVEEVNGLVTATVDLRVSFIEYRTNKSNRIIYGSKFKKIINNYLLTFVLDKKRLSNRTCPNCGAVVDTNVTSTCEYCKSLIVLRPKTFVLCTEEIKVYKPNRTILKPYVDPWKKEREELERRNRI